MFFHTGCLFPFTHKGQQKGRSLLPTVLQEKRLASKLDLPPVHNCGSNLQITVSNIFQVARFWSVCYRHGPGKCKGCYTNVVSILRTSEPIESPGLT